jgi:hypothetical protein
MRAESTLIIALLFLLHTDYLIGSHSAFFMIILNEVCGLGWFSVSIYRAFGAFVTYRLKGTNNERL